MSLACRFMALFDGLRRAHGSYRNIIETRSDGKRTGTAVTKPEPVTEELWAAHLEGRDGIGIVPIRDDSTVVFGAIDVDVYPLDITQVSGNVSKLQLPMVPCRTKSGGVHLYLFCAEPVPASTMVDRLREIAALLGYGASEIFPKQVRMDPASKDLGSWINAPYFNHAETNRYAVRADGDAMTAEEFLAFADAQKVKPEFFTTPLQGATAGPAKKASQKDGPIPDGPPCLQNLIQIGFPEGTRNVGLFNLGTYFRKSRPTDWTEQIDGANQRWMQPPLPSAEVGPIVRSLRKKDYVYECSKQPLVAHCNSVECRRRKYGVGGGSATAFPVLGELRKLLVQPPVWYLDVSIPGEPKDREGVLELTTDDLQNPRAFQRECINKLSAMPVMPSAVVWTQTVQHLLSNVQDIEPPKDEQAGVEGLFWALLEDFCTGRVQASTVEEVLLGKPFTRAGRTFFRSRDLFDWLGRKGFKEWKLPQLTKVLKMRKVKTKDKDKDGKAIEVPFALHDFENISGKGVNLWSVPAYARPTDKLPVPDAVTKQTLF